VLQNPVMMLLNKCGTLCLTVFSFSSLDDPQDAEVANQYKSNIEEFKKTAKSARLTLINSHDLCNSHTTDDARFWTDSYAKPMDNEAGVKMLTEMGFDAVSPHFSFP